MAKVQAVKIVGGPSFGPPSSASAQKRERDYQGEDDHRSLVRADEIRQDPKRMTGARRHARSLVRTAKRLYSRSTSR